MKIKVLVTFAVFFLATIFSARTALADDKFSATYNVTYTIQTSGTTAIVQQVDLKNLTATFYATEYTLSIGATKIKNVSARDSDGSSIPVTVTTEGDTTKIHATFQKKVVGVGKVLSWQLRYESDDIAVRNGFVWEVTIPKLASPESIASYNLTLRAPLEIGTVASISPQPKSTGTEAGFNTFSYEKDQLISSGVNASFGDHQVFNFTLKYHLENTRFFPVIETVALPPDTETQTMIYTALDPKPQEIGVDTDGNYLAKFRLNGNQKLDVTLSGQAKIWNKPTNPPLKVWTEADLKKFTASDKYWETSFPAIADKAKELKTPKAIYDYVATTLKYDYQRAASDKLERLGATVAIKDPTKAVCMEFTDLFIALARAAGIPARELDGFAYTTNSKLRPRSFSGGADKSDILHAWAEYWNADQKAWVQIDPTWGSTTGGVDYFDKLDMNHVVFVIKGLSSVEPFPAGSYKTDPSKQKGDVDVTIAPAEVEITTKPELSWQIGQTLVGGLPFGSTVKIENFGNSTVFASKLSFKSKLFSLAALELGPIPPMSSRIIPLSGRIEDFNSNSEDNSEAKLTATSAKGEPVNLTSTKNLHTIPLYLAAIPWIGGLLILLGSIYLGRHKIRAFLILIEARVSWLLKHRPGSPRIPV